MTKKYKILGKFIKDMSSETKDIETHLYVKDHISKYQLGIDINSKALKNKLIEVSTALKFEDKSESKNKSYFEIIFLTIIKVNEEMLDQFDLAKEKKELERIILCDVQNEIYIDLEKSFLNLLHNSGYPGVTLGNGINFEDLYNKQFS